MKNFPPPSRFKSRSRVLDIIRATGPTSRIELAQTSGLTGASISNLVRELIDDGLVSEVGRAESTGGKPRTMLELNPGSRTGIGIQLGAASVSIVAADLAGSIIGRQILPGVRNQMPATVVDFLSAAVAELIANLGLDAATISGLGIAMPGPLNRPGGYLQNVAYLENLAGFALGRELERVTGLPTLVENDATAAAVGEYWLGSTDGYRIYASVYMATGIGSGVVIDGKPFRGASSNAGELGHVSVDPRGGPCSCGNRGCLEPLAAPPAVVRRAAEAVDAGELELEILGNVEDDMARLGMLAARGNLVARRILGDSADAVASAIVTLTNLFDVELIVLAGPGFVSTAAVYLEAARRAVAERALARGIHPVRLVMSASPRDAAALGAATLALQGHLEERVPRG